MAKKLNWIVPVVSIAATLAVIFVLWVILFSPQKGTLVLHSQINIQLTIDGQDQGQGNDFEMSLPVGNHEYVGIIKGQGDWHMKLSGTFTIDRGQTTTVNCGADPEVEFTSDPPGATVTILADNNPTLGVTPLVSNIPPGTYTFIFNLDGKARQEGPIEISFDQKKKVDAFFGDQPKKGSNPEDKLLISSLPEGLKILRDDRLAGITPVSFETNNGYGIVVDNQLFGIPQVYPKQFVWIRENNGMNIAISRAKIENSGYTWFANGGFFKSYIENGFLKIFHDQDEPLQIKLPKHDKIICLDLHGNSIRFAGADGQKLLMLGFDAITGKQSEIANKGDFALSFSRQLQSLDGSVSRFYSVISGSLHEVDIANMNLIDLGKCPPGMILRRYGETTDFCVGILSAEGLCHGIRSHRFAWTPEKPVKPALIQNVQPAIMCFYDGSSLVGFNTGSGSVEWQSELPELPLQISWNEKEQIWIAQSQDSKRSYVIDPNQGTVIPLEKDNTFTQENPFPGYTLLGYFTSDGMTNQIFYSPVEGLMMPMDGKPSWKVQCSKVYSTNAFNQLTDIGQIYIEKDGRLFSLEPSTGKLSGEIQGPLLGFFENGTVMCQNGVWHGRNQIFFGQCQATMFGNSLKIVLNDGSSCVILP